jgi:hypothetical protein
MSATQWFDIVRESSEFLDCCIVLNSSIGLNQKGFLSLNIKGHYLGTQVYVCPWLGVISVGNYIGEKNHCEDCKDRFICYTNKWLGD